MENSSQDGGLFYSSAALTGIEQKSPFLQALTRPALLMALSTTVTLTQFVAVPATFPTQRRFPVCSILLA